MINFKSFRFRLLSQFLIIKFLALLFALLIIFFYLQREEILTAGVSLNRVQMLVTQSDKMQHEFYTYESSNPNFFITGKSEYLIKYDSINNRINQKLQELKESNAAELLTINDRLDLISNELAYSDRVFKELIVALKERGFKDWGIEGVMRDHIHSLESYPELVETSKLLMLRRHEKDFILRNDSQYVEKLHKVLEDIINDIEGKRNQNKEKIAFIINELDAYKDRFNELVALEFQIGMKTNTGLISKLNESHEVLDAYFFQTMLQAGKKEKELLNRFYYYLTGAFIFFMLFILNLSFALSRKITKPITQLSNSLNQFVSSNFSEKAILDFSERKDEIGELGRNFDILEEEIMDQIYFFNQKVEQKTAEVIEQNKKIKKQNEQIELKNKELQSQKDKIEKQKKLVEDHNRRLLDSIRYAKKIQKTILPNDRLLNGPFDDHFIYYQPKDIVSGDFYWIEPIHNKKKVEFLIACVDCTGHGVPGAFMSLLGHTILNDAIKEVPTGHPGKVLNYLHDRVYKIFNNNDSNEDRLYDGMDLSMFKFNPKNRKLHFSGAYNSLFIVRNAEVGKLKCDVAERNLNTIIEGEKVLYEIKGDRFAIGHYEENLNFSSYEMTLKKGDRIYLTTDGYTDQFGGEDSKRFQKKRFRELLIELGVVDMLDQRDIIDQILVDWKGKIDQIDDICILGMEV